MLPNAVSHSSGSVRPSGVDRRENRRSAGLTVTGWLVGENGKERTPGRLLSGLWQILSSKVGGWLELSVDLLKSCFLQSFVGCQGMWRQRHHCMYTLASSPITSGHVIQARVREGALMAAIV